MKCDFDKEIADRKKQIESIFISMVVDKLSNTTANDLHREINKMSYSIVNTIWDDKKLNENILTLVYGDRENIGTDEVNYSYQSLILYNIQEAIESAIRNIVLEHIIKVEK